MQQGGRIPALKELSQGQARRRNQRLRPTRGDWGRVGKAGRLSLNREGNRETKLNNDRWTSTKLERLETRDWGEREILGRETLRQ